MRSPIVIVAALLCTPALAGGQGAFSQRVDAIRRAVAARQPDLAVRLADALVAWAPGHPTAVLARARALAAAGRNADAARAVRRLLAWDPRYAQHALRDSTLAPLRSLLRDVDIDALAENAARPIARGHVWAEIAERDLVAEGTAWDPATRSLLVGSLNKNKIVAIALDGTVRDRVARGAHGLGSVVGIHVDSMRRVLWVTSTPRYDNPADTATPALFSFDVVTGGFRRRIDLPAGPAFPNDLTTGPDGTVYVTDSRGDRVLVLRPAGRTFEQLGLRPPLSSPNGITISADGRYLFVSDLDHVRVVSLRDRRSWRLALPDSINMAGIDGLAFAAGSLIAHHALAFWRIARYRLDADFQRVTGVDFIERNSPDTRTSTTGEVVGVDYYYIGNGQLDRMNNGTIDSATMEPIRMYRAPLHLQPDGIVAVALSAVDSVVLFDARTLERLATLPVGTNPHEIAASDRARAFYVANARDSSISVIAVSGAPRVAATWRLPDTTSVHDVAVGDDGSVWAISGRPPLLFRLDAARGEVLQRHSISRSGSWMLEPGGPDRTIVVANLEGGAVTLVAPASGHQRVLEATEGEIDAQATRDGSQIWSVNSRTGNLTVFDSRSGHIVSSDFSGAAASRVVFTPDGRTALVVHGGDATVVAYDVETRRRRGSVTVARGPKVIALSNDGRRAYITHPAGTLTMIDVPSLNVLRAVELAGAPDGVAIIEPPHRH